MERLSVYVTVIISSVFVFGTIITFTDPVYHAAIGIVGVFGTFFLLMIYTFETEDKQQKLESEK